MSTYCDDKTHGLAELTVRDCWNCGGEGYSSHDCGEDCCCCADPEPNVPCDVCNGKGAFAACPICSPEEDY